MTRWTPEEEQKLLELYSSGHSYEEMVEELGRSQGSIRGKLQRLKGKREEREETREPLYTKNSGAHKEPPEPEKIHHDLVVALLQEFEKLRQILETTGKKQLKLKPRFYNNLFRCTETLLDVLKAEPEETSLEQWAQLIARKLPRELREPRRCIQQWTQTRSSK